MSTVESKLAVLDAAISELATLRESLATAVRERDHATARIDELIDAIPEGDLRDDEDVADTMRRIGRERDELIETNRAMRECAEDWARKHGDAVRERDAVSQHWRLVIADRDRLLNLQVNVSRALGLTYGEQPADPPTIMETIEALLRADAKTVADRDELARLLRDWRKVGSDRWHQGSLNEATDAALAKLEGKAG